MNKRIIIELTSFLNSNVITGIQRVVIEIVSLMCKNKKEDVTLIKYDSSKDRFYIIDNNKFLKFANSSMRKKQITTDGTIFNLETINNDCVFIDIDSSFDVICKPRFIFYQLLKKKNCKIVSFVYDLLPIRSAKFWPCYQNNFMYYISSVLKFSDIVIVNTDVVRNQLKELAEKCKYNKQIYVVRLGSNLSKSFNIKKVSPNIMSYANKRYILIVATIEPRKNHLALVKAYLNCVNRENTNLVIVGRLGWMYEEVFSLIKSSGLLNKKIFVVNNANNDEIIYLYKNAFCFVFPSFDEGYGLPIVEALFYKCPVFASDIPIFKEISQKLIVGVNNVDYKDIGEKINLYINNYNKYKEIKSKINLFKIISWEKTYISLLNYIK